MLVIIQPATLERVLSGICYKASWLYFAARKMNQEVKLYEEVGLYDCDEIFNRHGPGAIYAVDLSSYPQQDLAEQIYREFRDYNPRFFGLDGLIKSRGLPLFDYETAGYKLEDGAFDYAENYSLLLDRLNTDYDSHVATLDNGKPFVPAFFSVGCDRKCPYCYVGYTSFPSNQIKMDKAKRVIDYCSERGWNIHFYDEDFFMHPDINEILEYMQGKEVQWICLTTSISLGKKIRELGADYIRASGNLLNEVGVETTDPNVLDKKQDLQTVIESGLNIFWLTVTFFPGETIRSKNMTGQFLKAYGYGYDSMVLRMRCNSTVGGLGQFFVPYHGTPWLEKINDMGVVIGRRPTRLWPGFVGNKFLQERPMKIGDFEAVDSRWFSLYGHKDKANMLWQFCNGSNTVEKLCSIDGELDPGALVQVAQLAQLNLVTA